MRRFYYLLTGLVALAIVSSPQVWVRCQGERCFIMEGCGKAGELSYPRSRAHSTALQPAMAEPQPDP